MMDVMHERCAGLDVHKAMIVACVRLAIGGKVSRECRTFDTTTTALLALLRRDNQGENGATIWMRMPPRGCRREGVARP